MAPVSSGSAGSSHGISKIAVIGAGAFGFAIAKILSDNNPQIPIILYDPVKAFVDAIQEKREHPIFHKGVVLGGSATATHDLKEAAADADLIVLAVPGLLTRKAARDLSPCITKEVILLNVAKAYEPGSNRPLLDVISEELRTPHTCHLAALSGGMIANEVSLHWPAAADIACKDISVARRLQGLFASSSFKVHVTDDVLGVQLAGALKNVVAIGAGFFDGLGYEKCSKSAYVSEAAREMRHFAMQLGAHAATFDFGGHAWLGDLLSTCYGNSRNRYFGELLGKGVTVSNALQQLEQENKRAEGYPSAKAFYEIARTQGLRMPIMFIVHDVLYARKPVAKAIEEFMAIG